MLTSIRRHVGAFCFLLLLLLLGCGLPALTLAQRPIAVALIGQSNGTGQGDSTLSADVVGDVAREWQYRQTATGGSGVFRANLTDPVCKNCPTSQRSGTGSMIPALAQALNDSTGAQVLVAACCQSSTPIWTPPGANANVSWRANPAFQSQLYTNSLRKIRGMLASSLCPDTLRAVIITEGETDGLYLQRYPSTYTEFPHGYVVDSAMDNAGNIIAYPDGYPNPTNKDNLYTVFRQLVEQLLTDLPGTTVIVNETGEWVNATADHRSGCRKVGWVQRRVVLDLQAQGRPVKLVRGARRFPQLRYLKADGVHYNQAGLNWLGAQDARAIR